MNESNSAKTVHEFGGWLPLCVLPLTAVVFGDSLPAWAFMWVLAFSIYVSLKWLTWWQARGRIAHPRWRSMAYLLAWPGMDADTFLDGSQSTPPPEAWEWLWAFVETTLGAVLLWAVARHLPERDPLIQGWVGMVGLILLLHFGLFQLLALLWRLLGIRAEPIMRAPLRSASLAGFWGRRWNLGFRELAHELIFRPAHRKLGTAMAGFLVFVVSGLIHDLVISLPSRGGYGLPTLYFVLQGTGVAIERSRLGKKLALARGVRGWCFMIVFLATPLFWLFHPWFVMRVILPFMGVIHAL